jgi:hypothetical protein
MNANVFLLALSQALMMTMVGLVLSSSAVVAVGSPRRRGWPTCPRGPVPGHLAGAPSGGGFDGPAGRRPVFVGAALVGPAAC